MPDNREISGIYTPNNITHELLAAEGYGGEPMIVIAADSSLAVQDMPGAWGLQNSSVLNNAAGTVEIRNPESSQLYMDLDEINGVSTNTLYMGSEICRGKQGWEIRIAHIGWDVDSRLVFTKK